MAINILNSMKKSPLQQQLRLVHPLSSTARRKSIGQPHSSSFRTIGAPHSPSNSQEKHKIDYKYSSIQYTKRTYRESDHKEKKHIQDTTDPSNDPISDPIRQSINKYMGLKSSPNQMLKDMVFSDLLTQLAHNHSLLSQLELPLLEALIMTGKIEIFKIKQEIPHAMDQLCILIFGRVKISCQDFKIIINEGQTFGEQKLFGVSVNANAIALDQSCVLSIPLPFYKLIRKESIMNGFKQQFNKFQSIVRLNFINKNYSQKLARKLK